METIFIDATSGENTTYTNDQIADFLVKHLEQYGDEKKDILKCIAYVYQKGGFIILATNEDGTIAGAVIVNETGMGGYIPENILVYIAVDAKLRGKGVGKTLMSTAMESANGDVALHVEPDNPAKILYEKLGFTNKYLEMRWSKK